MRAFYRIKKTYFRDRGEATVTPENLGAVMLLESGGWTYVYASDAKLMPRKAEMLAGTWEGLKDALTPAQGRRVFRKVVKRMVTEDGETVQRMVRVRMDDTDPSDTVRVCRDGLDVWVESPAPDDQVLDEWLTPHQILGD